MNDKPEHVCFSCDHALVEYDEAFGKERTYCQVPWEQASRYKDKVFSGGKLIHCPAFLSLKAEAEDGGN